MQVLDRSGVMDAGVQVALVCETQGESAILDSLGKPGDRVCGELRVSDGYGQFYILIKPIEKGGD